MILRKEIVAPALFLLIGIVAAIQYGKIAPLIPVLRGTFALDLIPAGWLASLISIVAAIGGYAIGYASDRIGQSRALKVGLLAFAIGNVVGALATAPAFLFLGRFVEGIGYVSLMVSVPSLIVRTTPSRLHRLFLGLWGAVVPAGMMLIMLTAGSLHRHIGWQSIWWASALAFAAMFLLVAARPCGPASDATPPRPAFSIDVPVGVWILAGCFAIYTMQWLSLVTWLPSFYHEGTSSSAGARAFVTAMVVGANIVGNLLGTALLYRGVASWVLMSIGAIAMAAACVIVFAIMPSAGWLGLVAFAGSLLGGFIPPSALSEIPLHTHGREKLSAANGIVMQGASIGSLLGPPAAAALYSPAYAWAISGSVLAAASILSLGIVAVLKRRDPRTTSS